MHVIRKSAIFHLLILTGISLLGVILGIILAEASLRQVIPYQLGEPNPWEKFVGWAGHPYEIKRPNSTRVNTKFISYNQYGLRDNAYPYDKPKNTYRILIVGDSYVESEQTILPETFHKRLEVLLNGDKQQRGCKYEVIAAGGWGWGTDQALLYFEHEGYKYQPDLTMLMFVYNDVCNNYVSCEARVQGQTAENVLKPYFTVEKNQLKLNNFPYENPVSSWKYGDSLNGKLYRNFRVFQLGYEGLVGMGVIKQLAPTQRLNTDTEAHPATYVYADQYSSEYVQAWKLTKRLILEFKNSAQKHNSEFVLVSASSDLATYPEAWSAYTDTYPQLKNQTWNWKKPDSILNAFARQKNFFFIPLQPGFSTLAPLQIETLHIPIDQHWSPKGHEVAAHLLHEALLDLEVASDTSGTSDYKPNPCPRMSFKDS